MVRLTFLVENCVRGEGLLAQHGLSLHIEAGAARILFDAGADGEVLVRNARRLGIDLSTTSHIVLSHGHFDHGGGIATVMDMAPEARVFIPRGALLPRWSGDRDIALPLELRDRLVRERNRWTEVDTPLALVEGISMTGPVPGTRPEWTHEGLLRNRELPVPDDVPEEQALVLESAEGIFAVAGCAHYGLGNLSDLVARTHPGRPLRALVGGLHLESAPEAELETLLDLLRDRGLECAVPAHCTGWTGTHRLLSRMGPHCEPARVGKVLTFPA
jgi:7,8-dihydropterin-6-yl-methyl-4-(beta-D-ribofuranosyl)aminobenzene 5'-phosphate synthase